MKLLPGKNKVLIIIIGFSLILSLNLFQKEVKGFFYFLSAPVQKTFWQAGDGVSDFFEAIFDAQNFKRENETLNLQFQRLLAENSSLQEIQEENQILREALEIGLPEEFKLVLAEVTGKDFDQDTFVINKGFRHGLTEGMPVITHQKVLLGKITEVYENFARVQLISNKKSSFDGKIPARLALPARSDAATSGEQGEAGGSESDFSGVVRGRGGFKLHLDLVPQEKMLKEGDLVVSSVLGGIYPAGLLVGLIEEIQKSDVKPFQEIKISPFFNIEELEKVFVIINF